MIIQDYTKYQDMAETLKVLGHPVRLCIVKGLLAEEHNVTAMQECLELPQPVISQHLAVLKRKGIIRGERRGTEIRYKVVDGLVRELIRVLFEVAE